MSTYEEQKTNMYGFIWSHLSAESQDRLRRHDDFNDFDSERDPARCMRAIVEIHALNAGPNVVLNSGIAEETYRIFRQYRGESIIVFNFP